MYAKSKGFNVFAGCKQKGFGPGCQNCVARCQAWKMCCHPSQTTGRARYQGLVKPGGKEWTGFGHYSRPALNALVAYWHLREKMKEFITYMGDWSLAPLICLADTFAAMFAMPQHSLIILTRDIDTLWKNIQEVLKTTGKELPPNVKIGVSIENKACLWRLRTVQRIKRSKAGKNIQFVVFFAPLLESLGKKYSLKGIAEIRINREIDGRGHGMRYCDREWIEEIIERARKYNVPALDEWKEEEERKAAKKAKKEQNNKK